MNTNPSHLLLKWNTFRIASVVLLVFYLLVLLISYDKRSVHWIITSSVFIGLIILSHASVVFSHLHPYSVTDTSKRGNQNTKANVRWWKKIWFWILAVSVCVAYGSLSSLLYTTWHQIDDYSFMVKQSNNIVPITWDAALWGYTTWVARCGDFFITLFHLSESRAWVWIVTPAMVVSIPFALYRLFRQRAEDTILSPKGFLFFWFCFFLFILCNIAYWRPFWCYAAGVNYLWTSVGFLWLISCYNPVNWNASQRKAELLGIGVFLLGFLCGWAMECTVVTLVPLLVAWGGYNIYRKKPLPGFCWAGVVGAIWGAFVLLASPAHITRAARIANTRKIDIAGMTPEQITNFVQNLDWNQVNLLKGAASNISLQGIPLHQHVYFIPYAWDRLWEVACVPLVVALVSMVSLLLSNRCRSEWKKVVIALALCTLSCVMAFSYLAACIPTHNSFLPCAFVAATAAALLFFAHSDNRWSPRQLTATGILILIGLLVFIPAGKEAWRALPYRDACYAEIHRQKAAGIQDIVLPYPLPDVPANKLRLIGFLNSDAKQYPNTAAARYYKVRSIRMLSHKETVALQKRPESK